MPIGTGLDAQLGIAEESTYGTPVVVTRFYEFVEESLEYDPGRIESEALRKSTRIMRSDDWRPGNVEAGGDIELELANKSQSLLLKHCFGAVVITTPGGATATRDQTHTPGDLLGDSLTIQKGVPFIGGTVQPMTFHGCKVASWKLSSAIGEIARLGLSIIAEDMDTSTGLAVAAYPTGLTLMTYVEGKISIAGSEVFVTEASVEGDNGLSTDRRRLGSRLRREPLEAGMRAYTGELNADWDSLTALNRFLNGTEASLELLYQGATIEGAFKFETKVVANVRFDGEVPKVSSPEEIRQPLQYKVVDDGTTSISLVYRTTDTVI